MIRSGKADPGRSKMPARPSWHTRVPTILETLRAPGASPILDRAAFEQLFGVGRRQAVRLMHMVGGGFLAGRTALVERQAVMAYLTGMDEPVNHAVSRRRRILSSLEESRRPAVAVQQRTTEAGSLPRGVARTGPGKLEIEYRSATDLLSLIVDLASAAAGDFEEFRRSVE